MGNAWEIGSHTFSIKWVVFSIRLPSCPILHRMGNALVFLSISQGMGNSRKTHRMEKARKKKLNKMQQNPSNCENLGNWYPFFSWRMDTFLPSDSHLMVYFITWKMHGFSHKFLIAWGNAAKSTLWVFWLFFHSIIGSTFSKIYWFFKRKNRKNR